MIDYILIALLLAIAVATLVLLLQFSRQAGERFERDARGKKGTGTRCLEACNNAQGRRIVGGAGSDQGTNPHRQGRLSVL